LRLAQVERLADSNRIIPQGLQDTIVVSSLPRKFSNVIQGHSAFTPTEQKVPSFILSLYCGQHSPVSRKNHKLFRIQEKFTFTDGI
jgi:hypothetical protein